MSIDGLQPEHDVRRTPATYDRILKHIEGHQITVHCTVTRQQVRRDGYLEEFLDYWQANPNTRLIWISLYTPQVGELSTERLTKADRAKVIADLSRMRKNYSKLQMLDGMLKVYAKPPDSPEECIFAQTTECYSSDLERRITPCQFGGKPDCQNCGCIASAGLEAIGRHRLNGGIRSGRSSTRRSPSGAQSRRSDARSAPPPNACRRASPNKHSSRAHARQLPNSKFPTPKLNDLAVGVGELGV